MFTLASFTPAELEKISGLSTTNQRAWRSRGYLPASDGHARYDPFDAAELMVMSSLADRGVGPVHSGEIAQWAAIGIMWHTLHHVDSYEGDHERTFEWEPEGRGTKRPMDAAVINALEDRGIELPEKVKFEPRISWGVQAGWMARRIISRRRSHVIPERFLIWWANDDHVFHRSLDEAFNYHVTSDPECAGPVIVLDLQAMASTLGDRAGRALVRVEYDKDRAGKVLSPDPEIEFGAVIPLTFSPLSEKAAAGR
ncbi:MAG: hypothetical protein SGJ21_03265 [Alphaproteobacteria bacterium]|nr:hypothetical protein [Alphaproteobacteria bacterium]